MASEDMEKLKSELTDNALTIAKEFGVQLDYSHESIENVEEMLGEVHAGYKETKDEEGLMGIGLSFAAYIISVIEHNSTPGLWQRNHPTIGKDSFPYTWKGSTLFPYVWCMKRILDDEADDVWVNYKDLVMARDEDNQ